MDEGIGRNRIFHLFADILEYPQGNLIKAVQACEALLATKTPKAAALLGEFVRFVEKTDVTRLEEVYTGTFDLNAMCHPYVGYHLFGESYKRSVFLMELKNRYRTHGFAVEKELPDHLTVLLRFLAVCDDEKMAEELAREALLPVLNKMLKQSEDAEYPAGNKSFEIDKDGRAHPYMKVLEALQLVLRRQYPKSDE